MALSLFRRIGDGLRKLREIGTDVQPTPRDPGPRGPRQADARRNDRRRDDRRRGEHDPNGGPRHPKPSRRDERPESHPHAAPRIEREHWVPGRRGGAAPAAAAGAPSPAARSESVRAEPRPPHAARPHRDRRQGPFDPRHRPPTPSAADAGTEETPPRIADTQPAAAPPPVGPAKPDLGQTRFDAVGLPSRILGGIEELGFSRLSPLQEQVFAARAGKTHLIVQGGFSTGKTSTALILAFERLLALPLDAPRAAAAPRILILVPTRDLAMDTVAAATAMGRHTSFRATAIYGGGDVEAQRADLSSQPVDLLVSTPGRLLDFQERGWVKLDAVLMLVVDEADRLLSLGGLADVDRVAPLLPPTDRRATMVLAAALLPSLARAAGNWMAQPTVLRTAPVATATQEVEQRAYAVSSREKLSLLYNLLRRPEFERVLVFVNDEVFAERVVSALRAQAAPCASLPLTLPPERRAAAIEEFRAGRPPVLVLTDAAAAGLESERVTHAINCDMPREAEDYAFRLGFAGRGAAHGAILSFATENDSFTIPDIERVTGRPLPCAVPGDELLARLPNAPDFGDRGPNRFGDRRGPRDSSRRGDRRSGPRRR